MLAKRRALKLNGQEIERTPLLIPSFSSKGFPDVRKIIEYSSGIIDGVMLISAYDLHYGEIKPPFDFASLIFVDSGGYEASKDAELGKRLMHTTKSTKDTKELITNSSLCPSCSLWFPFSPSRE